jgi:hypothetical protein
MAIPIQMSDATVSLITNATIDVPGDWVAQLTCLTDITKITFTVLGGTGPTYNNAITMDIGTGEPAAEVVVIPNIFWGDTDSAASQGGRNQGWLTIPWFFASGTKISARITGHEVSSSDSYEFQIIAME